MVHLQTKIHNGLELLQFFTTREWIFDSTNFLNLWYSDLMNAKDRELFNMDFNTLTLQDYMKRCAYGARTYCMKESPSTIPKCKRQLKL